MQRQFKYSKQTDVVIVELCHVFLESETVYIVVLQKGFR